VMALVSYVLIYTPMKGVSSVSLYLGAVPGALPPLLGYAGLAGELTPAAWSLFAVLFVWQIPHFLAIAVFRCEEYRRAGLMVLPAVKGLEHTKRAIEVSSLALVLSSFLPCLVGLGGLVYFLVALVSGGAFLLWAMRGRHAEDVPGWARSLFFASMPHLVLLFVTLAFTAP
jgi:heme o synthase